MSKDEDHTELAIEELLIDLWYGDNILVTWREWRKRYKFARIEEVK